MNKPGIRLLPYGAARRCCPVQPVEHALTPARPDGQEGPAIVKLGVVAEVGDHPGAVGHHGGLAGSEERLGPQPGHVGDGDSDAFLEAQVDTPLDGLRPVLGRRSCTWWPGGHR